MSATDFARFRRFLAFFVNFSVTTALPAFETVVAPLDGGPAETLASDQNGPFDVAVDANVDAVSEARVEAAAAPSPQATNSGRASRVRLGGNCSHNMITASIGRYGPYLAHDGKYAKLRNTIEVFETGVVDIRVP
mgnify:CR=1 FL=1